MIAITGSTGFVGKELRNYARQRGIALSAVARKDYRNPDAYRGCNAVIHLAGLAHRRSATLEDFVKVNCALALDCLRAAELAGVKRFVYVSSSKALRDFADSALALDESVAPKPGCNYGRSKLAAETQLLDYARTHLLDVVILRPALVIGSPPKANLKNLALAAQYFGRFEWSARLGAKLFSGFCGPRSYTGLQNLCSAAVFVSQVAIGRERVFHVADHETMSTSKLFQCLLALALSRRAQEDNPIDLKKALKSTPKNAPKVSIFSTLIKSVLRVTGMKATLNALDCPLVLDGTLIQRELGWTPERPLADELQRIMTNPPNVGESRKG